MIAVEYIIAEYIVRALTDAVVCIPFDIKYVVVEMSFIWPTLVFGLQNSVDIQILYHIKGIVVHINIPNWTTDMEQPGTVVLADVIADKCVLQPQPLQE
jgi:hypothetical protein